MTHTEAEEIPGIPARLRWIGDPREARYIDGTLTIVAPPRSDWFIDPASEETNLSAPALVARLSGSYSLSSHVDVMFGDAFGAGSLVLWSDDRLWAKLALEFSPDREALIVSVVTRGVSDDANSIRVEGAHAWLRITRVDDAYAFHVSIDGRTWRFVRHFTLGPVADPEIGFEAQSPMGEGCTVRFSEISYSSIRLSDLRDGS